MNDKPAVSSPMLTVVHVVTVPMTLRFLRGQAAFMGERGYEIVAVSSPGTELDAFAEREGIRVYEVPMQRAITPLRDLLAIVQLCRVLRTVRPSIVHGHTPKGGLLAMLAGTLAGVPVRIYHMRGLPFLEARGVRRVLLRWTERVSCALAHRVISVSQSLLQAAVEQRLVSGQKAFVPGYGSGQGVDAEGEFNPCRQPDRVRESVRGDMGIPHDAKVVGFVGRLAQDKGIEDLASAWSIIKCRRPDARLLLVGPVDHASPPTSRVLDVLGSDPTVHRAETAADIPSVYSAMDMLVLPTYREGFPNVVLEASAMGLPAVASRVVGCLDAVVDGVTGTLVPSRSPIELASAICAYLDDPARRASHGRAARARVLSDFTRERVWAAISQEYDSLTRYVRA